MSWGGIVRFLDSGIKFTPTSSSKTFDSAKRWLKFNDLWNKSPVKWAKDEYIKAVCNLQNSYLKNNCFGDKDVIFKKAKEDCPQQIELLMKDLKKSKIPSTRRLETR